MRVVMLAVQIRDREALNKLPEHRKVKILVLIRGKYRMLRLLRSKVRMNLLSVKL